MVKWNHPRCYTKNEITEQYLMCKPYYTTYKIYKTKPDKCVNPRTSPKTSPVLKLQEIWSSSSSSTMIEAEPDW